MREWNERGIRVLVLVEGESDRNALVTLARCRGLDLGASGIEIEPVGGAQAIGRAIERCGPRGAGLQVAGLYDVGEEAVVARFVERAGLGPAQNRRDLERLGFFACVEDLEDELIRALGVPAVEKVVAAQGELRSFRILQRQPAQRGIPVERQLRRFLGTHRGRKITYARLLVEALDPDRAPRPLDRVLACAAP